MADDIPEWAAREAYKRLAKACDVARKARFTRDGVAVQELGRMIAKHEPPPVDPVEAEVTRLLPHADEHPMDVIIRTAIRAGIGLAKEQSDAR